MSVFTNEPVVTSLRNITIIIPSRHPTSIEYVKFEEEEVYEVFSRINPAKYCGPDNIPGKILVEAALEIRKPLSTVSCMRTGEFPKDQQHYSRECGHLGLLIDTKRKWSAQVIAKEPSRLIQV